MAESFSLTGKRWHLPVHAARRDVHTLVSALQEERRLSAPAKAGTYPDIHRAVTRIRTAVQQKEVVGIFGDYDCDGITSTAQLVRYFRRHGIEPVVRLPHRVHDGYGLQKENISWFADKHVTLLITVDTGITSVEEVALATSKGIEVIVTDHHKPQEQIPSAYAILHPMLSPEHAQPHTSGAGVVYELLEALEDGQWDDQDSDRALAMMGIVADLVPLLGSNRTMVQAGLQSLQRITDGPLADLRDRTRSRTSTDVAFRIAPRINASGRMSDPSIALSALLEGGEALSLLDDLNEQRRAQMQDLYQDAITSIPSPEAQSFLWTASADYPHGIIGLIAGKLTEQYGKPSCAITIEGDTCTASLRSPQCYHITEGLSRCSALLHSYGGHAQAAGCSFPTENLLAFQQAVRKDVECNTNPQDLIPLLHIDAVLSAQDLTLSFAEALEVLEPYGQGNPEPRFLLRNITLESLRLVGADKSHLQCSVHNCKAIGFGLGSLEEHCSAPVDILCRIGIDSWLGKKQPQLLIEDLRLCSKPVPNSLPSGRPV